MKAIKATQKQFDEFKAKYAWSNKGEELYHEMMNHFKRTSQWRYDVMKKNLETFDNKKLFNVLNISGYTFNKSPYQLKYDKTIDEQKYVYLSLPAANSHIHLCIYQYGMEFPEYMPLCDTFDFVNTYLCTYNL